MIISASRRTDIPAFYMPWLLRRLEAGQVRIVNPFNRRQQRLVALSPDQVDAIVFWTRDPAALAASLPRLETLGYGRSVALVTINAYSRELEPSAPAAPVAAAGFRELAARAGAERLVWRYDPILLGERDTGDDHRRRFEALARDVEGATARVVVSFVDLYRKTRRRLAQLARGGYPLAAGGDEGLASADARELLVDLAGIAAARGMEVRTCAAPADLLPPAVRPGRCVDPDWLSALFPDRLFPRAKDPGQRPHCGCARAVDIGAVDTCLFGCAYCYAVGSPAAAAARRARHQPDGDALAPLDGLS